MVAGDGSAHELSILHNEARFAVRARLAFLEVSLNDNCLLDNNFPRSRNVRFDMCMCLHPVVFLNVDHCVVSAVRLR